MRCHIIRPFKRVAEILAVLGHQPFEEIGEIERNVGIRIFLDNERAGRVLDKDGKRPIKRRLPAQPILNGPGKRVQPFASRGNGDFGVNGCQTIRIRVTPFVSRAATEKGRFCRGEACLARIC